VGGGLGGVGGGGWGEGGVFLGGGGGSGPAVVDRIDDFGSRGLAGVNQALHGAAGYRSAPAIGSESARHRAGRS